MEESSPRSAAFPPHSPPTSFPSLFERFIGTMPLSDSSGTCTRAVWPKPSPAVLLSSWAVGISEVSRFSCMKFLGVSGVFDYAGLSRNSHLSPLFMLPSAHYKDVGVRIASFVGSRTGALLRRFSLAVAPRFLWECLNSQTVSWFPAPATSNVACGFPALRSPVCFRSRFIRHLGQEQLSRVPAVSAYSRCIARACGRSTHYSTVSSPCLCAIWTASAVAGSSFLPSLGSSKSTDSNDQSENSSPNPGGW